MRLQTQTEKKNSGAVFLGTLAVVAGLALASTAQADPCGMVPPAWIETAEGAPPVIQRSGDQITYAFFKDGVETMVLRPGFTGDVDEFGMLIPFPSAPAIRKTADDTFTQLGAAVDAPKVSVQIYQNSWDVSLGGWGRRYKKSEMAPMEEMSEAEDDGLRFDEVRVLNQEAVGMYEVAVLEAGSSKALNVWMEDHEFRYPEGMDGVVEDYVSDRWIFVAIKAQVGTMPGVAPVPGMTGVDAKRPKGSQFNGHVQGMGFRFKTDEPVIPMRMASFNGADERNLVYFLADEPLKIDGMGEDLVVRQVAGKRLYSNVTELLPLEVSGGTMTSQMTQDIRAQRNPAPYNGVAKELFAADLLAATTGELALPFEEFEKELLVVSESIGLRGPDVDHLHGLEVDKRKDDAVDTALLELKGMTLTVIDGDFDKKYVASKNIAFTEFEMASASNSRKHWTRAASGPTVYLTQDGGWLGGDWLPW